MSWALRDLASRVGAFSLGWQSILPVNARREILHTQTTLRSSRPLFWSTRHLVQCLLLPKILFEKLAANTLLLCADLLDFSVVIRTFYSNIIAGSFGCGLFLSRFFHLFAIACDLLSQRTFRFSVNSKASAHSHCTCPFPHAS